MLQIHVVFRLNGCVIWKENSHKKTKVCYFFRLLLLIFPPALLFFGDLTFLFLGDLESLCAIVLSFVLLFSFLGDFSFFFDFSCFRFSRCPSSLSFTSVYLPPPLAEKQKCTFHNKYIHRYLKIIIKIIKF